MLGFCALPSRRLQGRWAVNHTYRDHTGKEAQRNSEEPWLPFVLISGFHASHASLKMCRWICSCLGVFVCALSHNRHFRASAAKVESQQSPPLFGIVLAESRFQPCPVDKRFQSCRWDPLLSDDAPVARDPSPATTASPIRR